jgi:hypothetical protein
MIHGTRSSTARVVKLPGRLLHDLRRCLLEPPPQIHPTTPATGSAAGNVRTTT